MKNIFSPLFQFPSVSHHKRSIDQFHLQRCSSAFGTDPLEDPDPKSSAMNDYKHFRRDMQGRRSVGLALCVRKTELYDEGDGVHCLWIKHWPVR